MIYSLFGDLWLFGVIFEIDLFCFGGLKCALVIFAVMLVVTSHFGESWSVVVVWSGIGVWPYCIGGWKSSW